MNCTPNPTRANTRKRTPAAFACTLSLTAIVLLSGGGEGAAQATTLPAITTGPAGSNFWEVSTRPHAGAQPGDILYAQERADAPVGAKGWNVLYVSEIKAGTLAYVSGEIYIPDAPSSAPRDVVLWNHETTGVADACAPSRTSLARVDGRHRVPAISDLLARGYVVVMSDYPGQGLPGPAFYMAGQPNARASLDMLRVAQKFPTANASKRYVMYGWSQGGQTTMWAESIAASYAPGFTGLGAGLIAPAVRIKDLVLTTLRTNNLAQAGYLISTLPGVKAYFPDLQYRDVLTTAGLEQFPAMADGCHDVWRTAADVPQPYAPNAVAQGSPWWNALSAIDDFAPKGTMPFVIYQGAIDTTTPVHLTLREHAAVCKSGAAAQYIEFPGLEHGPIVPEAAKQFPAWAQARFEGKAAASNCTR